MGQAEVRDGHDRRVAEDDLVGARCGGVPFVGRFHILGQALLDGGKPLQERPRDVSCLVVTDGSAARLFEAGETQAATDLLLERVLDTIQGGADMIKHTFDLEVRKPEIAGEENRPQRLHDLDDHIPRGERLVVVGPPHGRGEPVARSYSAPSPAGRARHPLSP